MGLTKTSEFTMTPLTSLPDVQMKPELSPTPKKEVSDSLTNVTDTNSTSTELITVVESSWNLGLVLFIVIVSAVGILGLTKLL